ncbi:hypothetical protein [Bacillus pumilus]|uniref:hypothetical protein n=1 Tax=Bacillus pumilus TaxID=1408 RepID=UPI0011A4E826|nr:hypothetical protein [Bacillus pumilus]
MICLKNGHSLYMIVLHITSIHQVDRLGVSKYGMIKFARWAFFGLAFIRDKQKSRLMREAKQA